MVFGSLLNFGWTKTKFFAFSNTENRENYAITISERKLNRKADENCIRNSLF